MNRSLLRNLTGLVLTAAAVGALGGTAAGIGTDADAPDCRAWHPAVEVAAAAHSWNPASANQHPWPTAAAARTSWHQAAASTAASWHPATPASATRHAWNPTLAAPTACTDPTPGG